MEINLRMIRQKDLNQIWQYGFSEKKPEWKEWDGPYFENDYKQETYEEFLKSSGESLRDIDTRAISVNDDLVGIINYYWVDKKTRWLEIGIIIYKSDKWNKGIGTAALKLWIKEIFSSIKDIEHIGLTTWSGNFRMIGAALSAGMKEEARIRKVRYHNDFYYDSVKYGILREEAE